MTESTSAQPSMTETAAAAPSGRKRLLIWAAAAAAGLVLAAVAIILALSGGEDRAEVGQCLQDNNVVACDQPHEARIVQIVNNLDACAAPAEYSVKEADGRYLCVVDEPS